MLLTVCMWSVANVSLGLVYLYVLYISWAEANHHPVQLTTVSCSSRVYSIQLPPGPDFNFSTKITPNPFIPSWFPSVARCSGRQARHDFRPQVEILRCLPRAVLALSLFSCIGYSIRKRTRASIPWPRLRLVTHLRLPRMQQGIFWTGRCDRQVDYPA
jgi:hypothetical protein